MLNLLHTIGLMTRAEHERVVRGLESQLVSRENAFEVIEGERDRLNDRHRQDLKDIEALLGKISELRKANGAEANRLLREIAEEEDDYWNGRPA